MAYAGDKKPRVICQVHSAGLWLISRVFETIYTTFWTTNTSATCCYVTTRKNNLMFT